MCSSGKDLEPFSSTAHNALQQYTSCCIFVRVPPPHRGPVRINFRFFLIILTYYPSEKPKDEQVQKNHAQTQPAAPNAAPAAAAALPGPPQHRRPLQCLYTAGELSQCKFYIFCSKKNHQGPLSQLLRSRCWGPRGAPRGKAVHQAKSGETGDDGGQCSS